MKTGRESWLLRNDGRHVPVVELRHAILAILFGTAFESRRFTN